MQWSEVLFVRPGRRYGESLVRERQSDPRHELLIPGARVRCAHELLGLFERRDDRDPGASTPADDQRIHGNAGRDLARSELDVVLGREWRGHHQPQSGHWYRYRQFDDGLAAGHELI